MCSSTCACGCLTPFPGCLFYRVAQVPKNEAIYHIFKCASWNPEIHISLETTFTGTTTSNPLQLHPYVSKMIDGWDIKVTSLQHIIHAALSKRFAESAAGFKMLGDAFKIAVECPDENTARKHFANCSNEVVCSCSHTMAAAQCVCPQNSFQEPQNSTTNLPAIEPHLNITASETVMIDTDDTEVTLLVTSKNQFQMAQVVVDPPCSMHATSITGCYDCSEGAKATVYCRSDSSSDITLECTDQTFLIGCSKQTKPNVLKLQYDHAEVKDICSFRCGGKTSKIDLSGTLFYHTPTLDHEIFEDISPLLGTITKHWKITAAVIGGFTVIGLLIYFFGPTIIIAIIRILTNIILALPRSLLECTTSFLSLLLLRLTLNLLKYDIQETKNKVFRLENKIDTILTNTTPRHPCIFCEGDNEDGHRSSVCSVFPDPIARSFRLRDLNRCISCLAPAHGQCSNKCRGCGGTHHAILCTERSKQGPPQKRQRLEH
ncbi:hypothetical protein OSTOST_03841 [Ostertagia ostertagi]